MKTSRLLKTMYTQHCCSHSLHLLLMTDAINKLLAVNGIVQHCKDVVTKLHFKGHIVDEEMKKTDTLSNIHDMLDAVAKVHHILDCDANMPLVESDDEDSSRNSTDNTETENATSCNENLAPGMAKNTGVFSKQL